MSSPQQSQSGREPWHRWSSRQRERNHHLAHEASEGQPAPSPKHSLIPEGEPTLVASQDQIDAIVSELRRAGSFGYDSEFIGEESYHPKLCLIQVGTSEQMWLIDPLAEVDLMRIWELLADPAVEKIVHAGRQDLEPAVRALEKPPANVFDTQIAAAFAGLAYPASLGTLVEEATDVSIGRGLKFSQWDVRPLSRMQKHYAADDVRYLPLLRRFIGEKVKETGNTSWAEEACRSLADPSQYGFDVKAMHGRVRGAGSLDRAGKQLLDALLKWRNETAQRLDMPPRTLLKDGVLLDLARSPARTGQDLSKVRGLPRPLRREAGDELIALINRTLDSLNPEQEDQHADDAPLPPPNRREVERLWSQVVKRCEARSIAPAMATSKRELGRLVSCHAIGRALTRTPLRTGWRRELLGEVFEPYFGNGA